MTRSQILRKVKDLKSTLSLHLVRLWRIRRRYRLSFGMIGVAVLRSVHGRKSRAGGSANLAPKKILVVRLDALGDLVLTTHVFRELKKYYPESIVTAVVEERTKDILEANPHVDRIFCPSPNQKSKIFLSIRREISVMRLYWKFLRNENFDVALHPRNLTDYYGANLLMTLVDAPVSIKYIDRWRRGLARQIDSYAFRSMINLPPPPVQHEALTNVAVIEHLTGHRSSSQPEIFLTKEDRAFAERIIGAFNANSTIIGLGFGAQEKRRRWPLERWAEVISLLAANRSISVLVICSGAERTDGELLQSMLAVESQLVSGARVREAAACLAECDLYIGPDSGPAHVAAAVGCWPLTVSPHPLDGALDYSSSPAQWGPYSEHGQIVQPRNAIPPCTEGCDAVESHCILQVLPEQVAEVCEAMLHSIDLIRADSLNLRTRLR